MRSSIACSRCRRSKIKCVNNGIHTICHSCEISGRECIYPPPAVGRRSLRKEGDAFAAIGDKSDEEGPRRSRPKKVPSQPPSHANLPHKESPRAFIDALDAQILTPKVWTELFDIFQLHFSTDLPFLHPPTFLKPLRQSIPPLFTANFGIPPSTYAYNSPAPPYSPVFLLGFLALTARFHPQLVAHHCPSTSSRPSNPVVASDYYASALRSLLAGSFGAGLGSLDLERTQACLMLCLHDWGMCRGVKAWVALGVAMRTAQIMGLQYDADLDDEPLSRSMALSVEAHQLGIKPEKLTHPKRSDAFTEQEIRRRTFWSCFVMDRYLSSGKYRPQMLNVKDLRIQLPSSEKAFLFGEKVRTLLLDEEPDDYKHRSAAQFPSQPANSAAHNAHSDGQDSHFRVSSNDGQRKDVLEEKGRWEIGADEGVISRFIRVLDLYGQIVKWSCNGGRRRERFPPWDSRSEFHSLRALLQKFQNSLPRDLTLTPQNISAHITSRSATPYALLHTVCGLCTIMLNREYVPFIPLRCAGPEGPLDPPTFPPAQYDIPANFWRDSSRECYRAAREVVDLVRTCQEWNVMVETPIVGFTIYTVAFFGVYCGNFPWMDPDGLMCKRNATASTPEDSSGAEAARKALEILSLIRSRLKMADGWFMTIERIHLYFARMKKDWKKNTKALEDSSAAGAEVSAEAYRHLSLREGGPGGGVEEFKLLEKTLKEFGTLEEEDDDLEMTDIRRAPSDLNMSDNSVASEAAGPRFKLEPVGMDHHVVSNEGSVRNDCWNTVNDVKEAATDNRAVAVATDLTGEGNAPGMLAPSMANTYQRHSNNVRSSYATPHTSPSVPTPSMISPASQPTASTPSMPSPYPGSSYSQAQKPQQHLYTSQNYPTMQPYAAIPNADQNDRDLSSRAVAAWPEETAVDPKEAATWATTLHPGLSGDDIAAFAAGGEMQTWAGLSAEADGVGGWLSAVWGGGNVGM